MVKFALLKKKYKILFTLAPAVIFFDQWTKLIVLHRFELGDSVSVLDSYFNLTYIRNTGAAFGFLATAPQAFRVPFFLLIPLIAIFFMGILFRQLPAQSKWRSSALTLVFGGAIGNLIDRARLGFVVDFLDFHWKDIYHYPAFNVADSAICVGVIILMSEVFFEKDRKKNAPHSL